MSLRWLDTRDLHDGFANRTQRIRVPRFVQPSSWRGFHVVTFDHSSKVSNRFRWWEIFSWREKKREKVFRIQDASISVYLYFSFHWKKVGKERKGEHFSKWNRALSFRKILSLIEISLWSLKHEICNCDIKLKMMSTDFFFKKRMTIADRIYKKIFVCLYFQWNSNFSKQKSRCEIHLLNLIFFGLLNFLFFFFK